MTTENCYARIGGDWDGVLSRLGSEARVSRFLRMVPGDASFQTLSDALARGDVNTAFRAAHSLKGLALNLGLTPLAVSAGSLTELLRSGQDQGADGLFQEVRDSYDIIVAAILEWEGGGCHG